ncbi:DUF2721 domain-containing protein [Polynucleobacter paneuropaeus]|nr:DUF2721 domain-containing protein [Polynucleobacter paneuropaeus]
MDNSIDVITNNIQLALAPVFLLTAVSTLFNAISTRLARTVDRMRAIHKELQDGQVIDDQLYQLMQKEGDESKFRGRLCTMAIFFDVLSGVFISLTVLELFLFQAGALNTPKTGYVMWSFILGMASFMISMLLMLCEVVYGYLSAGWDNRVITK